MRRESTKIIAVCSKSQYKLGMMSLEPRLEPAEQNKKHSKSVHVYQSNGIFSIFAAIVMQRVVSPFVDVSKNCDN